MILLGIITFVIVIFFTALTKVLVVGKVKQEATEKAGRALYGGAGQGSENSLANEIRRMRFISATSPTDISSTVINFVIDVDTISYIYSKNPYGSINKNNILVRTINGANEQEISDCVSDFYFVYYTSMGWVIYTPVTDVDMIAKIGITLSIDYNKDNESDATLKTTILPRNELLKALP
ncbi:MAG: hypothetical protein ABID79_00610 [Elusimicrobiota bacterium]